MRRAIDHLVLCVRALDAAREAYRRFGFTLTPPARHPWGTVNSLVQLQGNFLELLAMSDQAEIAPPAAGEFSFARFNQNFLKKREGLSMLVFASADARRDRAEFIARGLQTYAPFDFSRSAVQPDGGEAIVSFSLAFATDPRLPDAGFFVCQQHAPQYFWKPDYQRHPNGALGVAEIVMMANDPASLADFFGKLLEPEAVRHGEGRLTVATEGGQISILDAPRLAARFPRVRLGDVLRKPYFAGFRILVADLAAAASVLRRNEVGFERGEDLVRIMPEHASGVVIELAPRP